MAITYQGAGAATANSTASTSCVVAYPAGIQAGDLLLLFVGTGSATLPTTPAGWTITGVSNTSGGSSPSFRFVYKIATGSESGSQTVTTPNAQNQGRMLLFRGVDQTTPMDVAGTIFGSSAGATAYNLPTLTTTATGAALIYAAVGNSATGTFTPPTVPATFTEVWDSIAANPSSTMGYLIWGSSGATGTVNLVKSNSIRGAAGLVALRPAATQHALSGTVAAVSDVSGDPKLLAGLSGAVAAVSGVSGAIDVLPAGPVQHALSGTVAATSAVTGTTQLLAGTSGVVAATTTATGAPKLLAGLSGAVAGTTALSGTIVRTVPFTGSVAGTTALTGSPQLRAGVAGSVAAVSGLTGAPNLLAVISGSVAAVTTVAGDIGTSVGPQTHAFSGTVAASTTVSGGPKLLARLSGLVAASTTVSGSVQLRASLGGTVPGTTALSGSIAARLGLDGQVVAVTDLTGLLGARLNLAGLVEVVTLVLGEIGSTGVEPAEVVVISIVENPGRAVSVSGNARPVLVVDNGDELARHLAIVTATRPSRTVYVEESS